MPNFLSNNVCQTSMIVIDFEEQIYSEPYAKTLHLLIENHIDLSAFYDKYNNDDGGRKAYDPAMMLKLLFFSYYKGITTSRDIAWHCKNNIILRSLCCDYSPHHTSIASFISAYPDAIESVFEQVLLVCDQEGLLGHELIAIDGCKMPSNAAKEHSGTFKELSNKREKIRKKIRWCLDEHKRLDTKRPKERDRKEQLKQESETLKRQFNKIDNFLKTEQPRIGKAKKPTEVKSNMTDNESAKMTTSKGTIQGYVGLGAADKKHQIIVDAQAFGEGQEYHTLFPVLTAIDKRYKKLGINKQIIDDQIVIAADTGFASEDNYRVLKEDGYNAYVPDQHHRQRDKKLAGQKEKYGKRHQDKVVHIKHVIPSTEFNFDAKSKNCICPAGNLMWLRGESDDGGGKFKAVFEGNLTDCRKCDMKNSCMRNPDSANTRKGHGRQVSFTYTNGKTPTDWMKKRIDADKGKVIYGHRMSVIEPVFGNIGSTKGLSRFSLRGKKKVDGQWKLYCLVHNIEKLMNYGNVA